MTRHDYIIGIDPDCDKSGVSYIQKESKEVSVYTLSFPELIDKVRMWNQNAVSAGKTLTVIVEASWLISHNWHANKYDSKAVAAAKGNSVGRNHETGRKLVEMFQHHGIPVEEIRPLKKCWKGKDGKITHEELSGFINGLPKRTNQEQRDAALIAWVFSGLPIRVKV